MTDGNDSKTLDVCPEVEVLRELTRGTLPVDVATLIKSHVPNCSRCTQTLASLEAKADATLGFAIDEPDKSLSKITHTESVATDNTSEWAAFPTFESFVILGKLGQGGMGVVYDAWDTERNARVALKTLPLVEATSLYRFKREFRARADLIHPNLVTLYELVAEGKQWFFTMDLIEGVDILTYLRRGFSARNEPVSTDATLGTDQTLTQLLTLTESDLPSSIANETNASVEPDAPDYSRARPAPTVELKDVAPIFAQLAEGLIAVHDSHLLHRDIKPSNVYVTNPGRVVILDFGLVGEHSDSHESSEIGEVNEPAQTSTRVGGTINYMAPEQAQGWQLTPACDWYSFGVVLFEALSGTKPFQGTVANVLRRKLHEEAPRLSTYRSDIPPEWDEFCARLLARRAEHRPTGREIRDFFADFLEEAGSRSKSDSARGTTVFVGREEVLGTLRSAAETAAGSGPVVLLVHGPSGVGKTTTLQQFLKRLGSTLILRGRCHEQESVPYKAIDSLIDDLVRQFRSLTDVELGAILRSDVSALSQLFPVLEGLLAALPNTPGEPHLDPVERRRRAFAAFRELVADLARLSLTVVMIDDFQWSDTDSALMLAELLKPPEMPNLLVVISYRSEYSNRVSSLQSFIELARGESSTAILREIPIEPLNPDETRELIARSLGESQRSPAIAEAIVRESLGSPLFVHELLRYVDRQDVIDSLTSQASLDLGKVFWSQVETLSEDARKLLCVLALAGRPIRQRIAFKAANVMGRERQATLSLRKERFVRSTGQRLDDDIEIYHDFLRETIVRRLEIDRRSEFHLVLAQNLEQDETTDPETLASHWIGAGEIEKGGLYYLKAADRATSMLAFERAAKLYELGASLAPLSEHELLQVRRKMGDAMANAGRSRDAAAVYRECASKIQGSEWVSVQRLAAYHLTVSGQIGEGLNAFKEILRRVGYHVPRSRIRVLYSIIRGQLHLKRRGRGFIERPESEIPPESIEHFDIIDAARRGISFLDPPVGNVFQVPCTIMALNLGEPKRVVRYLALQSAVATSPGLSAYDDELREMKELEKLVKRLDSPESTADYLISLGMMEYHVGHFRKSIEAIDQARSIYENLGRHSAWELLCCEVFELAGSHVLGDYKGLQERYQRNQKSAEFRANLLAQSIFNTFSGPILDIVKDDPASARLRIEEGLKPWPKNSFFLAHYNAFLSHAYAQMYDNQVEDALTYCDAQWNGLKWSFLMLSQIVRIPILGQRGTVLAAAARRGDTNRRLKRASRDAAKLERECTPLATALSTQIRALVAWVKGDQTLATTLFLKAAAEFDLAEASGQAIAARLAAGNLIGGREGAVLVREAEDELAGRGVVNPRRFGPILSGLHPSAISKNS